MFDFRRFSIDDTRCDMKVGTDSVLLGAWVKLENPVKVLDAGCGSGLLAIMIAQRTAGAHIDAVELSDGACSDALKNVANCSFGENITVTQCDITDYQFADRYDLIISNPPFFTEAIQSPSEGRAASRHEKDFGVEWLLNNARPLLNPGGSLAFIAPASRDGEIEFAIELSQLFIMRRCSVIPVEGRPAKRTLWQVSPDRKATPEVSQLTILKKDQSLTDEYTSLTSEFYL